MAFTEIARNYLPGRTAPAAQKRYELLIRKGYEKPRALPEKVLKHEAKALPPEAYGSRLLLEAYHRYYEKHVASRVA